MILLRVLVEGRKTDKCIHIPQWEQIRRETAEKTSLTSLKEITVVQVQTSTAYPLLRVPTTVQETLHTYHVTRGISPCCPTACTTFSNHTAIKTIFLSMKITIQMVFVPDRIVRKTLDALSCFLRYKIVVVRRTSSAGDI